MIAIVGLSVNFPGGVDSLQKLSKNVINQEIVTANFVEQIRSFDHAYFDIPLTEAETMDPIHRMLLVGASRAIYSMKDNEIMIRRFT